MFIEKKLELTPRAKRQKETILKVLPLHKRKFSAHKIAQIIGVSAPTVSRAIKNNDIESLEKAEYAYLKCEECQEIFKVIYSRYIAKGGRTKFCSDNCSKNFYKNRKCSEENCSNKVHGKGLCANHYNLLKKYGTTKERLCEGCQTKLSYNKNNPNYNRKYVLNDLCFRCYRISLRDLVFTKLGNKCSCCGEKEKIFLQIDHIHGGGRKHLQKRGHTNKYLWDILENLSDFQVLCANCNWGKHLNGGSCPCGAKSGLK